MVGVLPGCTGACMGRQAGRRRRFRTRAGWAGGSAQLQQQAGASAAQALLVGHCTVNSPHGMLSPSRRALAAAAAPRALPAQRRAPAALPSRRLTVREGRPAPPGPAASCGTLHQTSSESASVAPFHQEGGACRRRRRSPPAAGTKRGARKPSGRAAMLMQCSPLALQSLCNSRARA